MQHIVALVAEHKTGVLRREDRVVTAHAVHRAAVVDASLVDDVVELVARCGGPFGVRRVHRKVLQPRAERPVRVPGMDRIDAARVRQDDVVPADDVDVVAHAAIQRVGATILCEQKIIPTLPKKHIPSGAAIERKAPSPVSGSVPVSARATGALSRSRR